MKISSVFLEEWEVGKKEIIKTEKLLFRKLNRKRNYDKGKVEDLD